MTEAEAGERRRTGRVVVITGASSGIGAALSRLLGGGGDSLVLVARRDAQLRAVAAESGDTLPIAADATRREDVRRVVARALERFGRIDVWVNNAGQGITRPPSRLTDDDIDAMMAVNVKAVLYGMQEVLPHFQERGRGHIVNVSSMLGRIPFVVGRAAYSASKHYMNALTANFRDEIQENHPDIHVSIVSPGVVRTDFGLHARHGGPDSRSFPYSQGADDVAAVIARVIDHPRPDVYTRPGAAASVAAYYAKLGEDPS